MLCHSVPTIYKAWNQNYHCDLLVCHFNLFDQQPGILGKIDVKSMLIHEDF